jgi:hypothetical protein
MGKVRGGRTTYIIYYYNHDNLEDNHAIQALVIMTASGRYVGEYDIDGAPPAEVSGHDIRYKLPEADGNRIHFGPGGPPRVVRIDNDYKQFETAVEGMCSGLHPIRSRCG